MRVVELHPSSKEAGDRLARKDRAAFSVAHARSVDIISLNSEETYQSIVGFGGAFTEAGAHALSRMSAAKREEVLRAYFDPNTGSRYTLCRTHINSCDFSLGNYAYSEEDGDYDLSSFDISRDRELLIPFIKDAQNLSNNGFQLFASPWSPPVWMKTTGEMNNGGQLKPECREAWALYFTKYIEAYGAEGIPIWGLTVQNEPQATQTWDSCIYSHEEQRDFVRDYLGPRLKAASMGDVKVIVWDHNKDEILDCAEQILSDADAARYIWGVGFHWYAGDHFEALDAVHNLFPDKRLLATENCQEFGVKFGSWELGERYAHSIIGDLNNWAVGWVDWNMVLDETGGPNHAGNLCDAPIIADTQNDVLHYQNAYYYIGHFSRFIEPGAVRIGCRVSADHLEATAFKNPDGSLAMVVLNATEDAAAFTVSDGTDSVDHELPARSIATLVLRDQDAWGD
ncbi:MAG: glucosylceramidase [Verrucomicrobia bacterium]|nr:glucosylceramidase [Verrucomicrobiota bacterium]